ncbi:MAG: DUF1015 domain-containing protein [Phycisphaerales bacterium]|nr:DUF1015 domain-containing protein [Phycisphaerales bacterium]
MSTIRPLRPLRYDTRRNRDLSKLLTPPYDILDATDKAELLARDPRNFVVVDLPHLPPKDAGPQHLYEQAAATLRQWLAEGTMVQDQEAALYVYHQAYTYEGRAYVRKMFFAGLKLEPFGAGSIYPHERTFGGPKEDRLALTKATQAHLSPIFGLYEDESNDVARRLEEALPPEPLAIGTLDGVENRLWAVTDTVAIADVARLIGPKPTYIADGHHRCGTAMLYRDWLTAQRGSLPVDHPANFVLCVFCAMEDPGLLILPTHRVLPGLAFLADDLAGPEVTVTKLSVNDPESALAALPAHGPQAVAFFTTRDDTYSVVRPTREGLLDPLEPEHSPSWRRLGLAFLHAYLLDRIITPGPAGGQAPKIEYIKSNSGAVAAARQAGGCAFLLQPTTMAELRAVCTAGDLMPQKSTYFYPKLASGLVIHRVVD